MIRYLMTGAAAIAMALALVLAAAADVESSRTDYVRAALGPK
jgi:predicted outer membrane protein